MGSSYERLRTSELRLTETAGKALELQAMAVSRWENGATKPHGKCEGRKWKHDAGGALGSNILQQGAESIREIESTPSPAVRWMFGRIARSERGDSSDRSSAHSAPVRITRNGRLGPYRQQRLRSVARREGPAERLRPAVDMLHCVCGHLPGVRCIKTVLSLGKSPVSTCAWRALLRFPF